MPDVTRCSTPCPMRLALACLALLLSPRASAQDAATVRFGGQLDALDDTLTTGEALDRYLFDVGAGEEVTVELVSDAFDTWLVLKMPGGVQYDNDDWNGSRRVSRIVAVADSAGTVEALATTFAPGMVGPYRLVVSRAAPSETMTSPLGADGFAGTVWAEDCPGTEMSRTYLALGADGALRLGADSPAALADAPGSQWTVASGALLLRRGDAATAYGLNGAGVLDAGAAPCGDGARLLRIR